MTNQEWEERYRDFQNVLDKLSEKDLQLLSFIFECHPNYVGEVKKYHYIEYMWAKFRDLRNATQRFNEVKGALSILLGAK